MMNYYVSFLFILILTSLHISGSNGEPQVPCMFVFGDSLSDSGNNNNLISYAKANFPPYGIDFPGGATGRFCNGRTVIDLIGDHLGLESYIGPYHKATEENMARGVNYASGSSGIRKETGAQVGQRICLDEQLERHQKIIAKLDGVLGGNSSAYLKKCLYSVYVGSNDWMLNFYSGGMLRFALNPDVFGDNLLKLLTKQLTSLYEMGARKVIVFGMAPLGCLPPLALMSPLERCSSFHNSVMEKYNTKLKSLVVSFNNRYQDARFIFINSLGIVTKDMSGLVGLKSPKEPCCGQLEVECLPFTIPCADREKRTYWDSAHPTEAANRPFAARAYKATQPTDAYPMDISELANLQL